MSIFLGFLLISPIKTRFFLYLGEISYSVYLIQFFVIPFFFKFLKPNFNSELYGDIRGVLAILTIFLSSHLTYKYIELKSAKFLKKSFKLI
jgi:peptidoglycan/LPS O-acetylase OafA/YrhL